MKKWIPQYGDAALKNSEICDLVESCSNTEEEVLMSKRNSLVVVLEWNPLLWPSYASAKFLSRTTRTRTIHDFATLRFGTLPVCLTTSKGSASFAICSRPHRNPHKCLSLRFSRNISVRSVIYPIYPMGRPFLVAILPMLIIITTREKVYEKSFISSKDGPVKITETKQQWDKLYNTTTL